MMKHRILDFSGMADEEGLEPLLKGTGGLEVFDFKNLDGTNCYCDPEAEKAVSTILSLTEPTLNWIDTGDYHWVSRLTAANAGEQYNRSTGRGYRLLVFDHHPDMQVPVFGDILSCGGWVRTLLESDRNLEKVVLVGVNPDLLEETEGFGNRLAVIPKKETTAAEEVSGALGMTSEDSFGLYISVDKDVLRVVDFVSDWDQGCMTADNLKDILKYVLRLGDRKTFLGADICGGITSAKGGNAFGQRKNAGTDAALAAIFNDSDSARRLSNLGK